MMRFEGRKVIVTGGGRGIGRATAVAFAREGADVAVVARTEEEINSTALEIRSFGRKGVPIKCDVSSEEEVQQMVELAERELGEVDTLINNAGVARFAPITELSVGDWELMMQINARGTFLCARELLRRMIPRARGWIINVSSSSGVKPYRNQSGYCASKHAVVGFSKVLAMEAQPFGVRVSCVCPGGVDTKLSRELRDDVDFRKWMKPEEVAECILFLASLGEIASVDQFIVRRLEGEVLY